MFTAEGHLLFSAASKGEHSNGVGADFPEPGGFFTTAFFTYFFYKYNKVNCLF